MMADPSPSRQRQAIERNFRYHAPDALAVPHFDAIRQEARQFALVIVENTVESREQSLAITKLEEVVMWANAAIAREGK